MTTGAAIIVILLWVALLYVGAKIVFHAYFKAKLEYQELLFHRLKREECNE
jgi:hypothetical protein